MAAERCYGSIMKIKFEFCVQEILGKLYKQSYLQIRRNLEKEQGKYRLYDSIKLSLLR